MALEAAPFSHDFYQTLRRMECLYPDKPRWGEGLRPIDEPIRLGQEPDLAFAPAPLASFGRDGTSRRHRLSVRLFGLFGPNGPLPIHLTEYARERLRNFGDATFTRFVDIFHHRFLALFYRAWAQGQPHVNRDRPDTDRCAGYVGAFLGIRPAELRRRDTLTDEAKLFHAGALVRHVRNAEGLTNILQHFFAVPVRTEQCVGHWMRLEPSERTFLARDGAVLGGGAVVGSQVWDRQHKFRLHIGPLTLRQYESFLPGGSQLRQLAEWVRFYLAFELDWDARLLLKKDDVPPLTLDGKRRLGWTTWLGKRSQSADADDLCLSIETVMGRAGASVA